MGNSEWVIRNKKPVNGGLGTVNFFIEAKQAPCMPNGIILLLYFEQFVIAGLGVKKHF